MIIPVQLKPSHTPPRASHFDSRPTSRNRPHAFNRPPMSVSWVTDFSAEAKSSAASRQGSKVLVSNNCLLSWCGDPTLGFNPEGLPAGEDGPWSASHHPAPAPTCPLLERPWHFYPVLVTEDDWVALPWGLLSVVVITCLFVSLFVCSLET